MSSNKKIWLSSPHLSDNERKYVNEAFDSNWIAPVGPHINSFEEKISKISNDSHVAVLNSGTAAIHLALILLDVRRDDNVLCSSFTFAASTNPIVYLGAKPVFIDSEKDTWNMCPILLENAIIELSLKDEKPKAIILVHLYGYPAKMNEILAISKKYSIPLIEDAAEAIGSSYNGIPLGTFGDLGVFSFNGNKIITTSSGGALLSSNKKFIDKAKFLSTQARDEYPHYEHSEIGYNYRMSNICAAIGLGQIEVLKERVDKRRYVFDFYKEKLSDIKEIKFVDDLPGFYSNRWLTTILFKKDAAINRESMRLHLLKDNIESRPLWKPMHLQPVFKKYQVFENGISEDLFDRGLCLPSGSNMNEEDLMRVIRQIKMVYEK